MRTVLVRAAALAGSLAATGVLFAATAFAHGAPFKVTAGSAAPGTVVAFSGVATNPVLRDLTSNATFTCSGSTLSGSLTTGSSNGHPAATVNGSSASFTGCTGPGGLGASVTGLGTWNLDIDDSTNGVSTGALSNVRLHVAANGGSCPFDLLNTAGPATPAQVPITYANSSGNLTTGTGASFGAWNVNPSGSIHRCGPVSEGDQFSLTATYHLNAGTAAYNPIGIS